MAPPLLVIVKIAVPVLTPPHAPCTVRTGGLTGWSLVEVGVGVGRREQEPVTFNVTEDRKEVLYVTVMLALPSPLIVTDCPGSKSTGPLLDGSDNTYVPSLTLPEMFVIRKVAV